MAAKKKKLSAVLKLQCKGGQATPAPPVGTALGPHGVNIGDFVRQFNDATKDKIGYIIPVLVSVFEDRSFTFELKSPPASVLLRKAAGIEKGHGEAGSGFIGTVTRAQIKEIVETKKNDLNASSVEAACRVIEGTARSMGLKVEG
ncbi:MAG TPA: 50S ribosomal protein L11 [Planctomycetota bacterium]|nr:50S ribosomal protein L11 [Planctomycetota bacterium]